MGDHALRVVTIFLWKQTITSFVNRKHNRCIIIKYSPWIEWVDSSPEDQKESAETDGDSQENKEGPMDREITEREVIVTQLPQQTRVVTVKDQKIDAVLDDVYKTELRV